MRCEAELDYRLVLIVAVVSFWGLAGLGIVGVFPKPQVQEEL